MKNKIANILVIFSLVVFVGCKTTETVTFEEELIKNEELSEEEKNSLNNELALILEKKGFEDLSLEDLTYIKELLENGAEFNNEVIEEYLLNNLFIFAAGEGEIGLVELLISMEIDINANLYLPDYPEMYLNALIAASFEGHTDIVILLIEAGAELDSISSFGITAISEAAREGHIEVVELLIDADADISITSGYTTPLMNAISEGHLEIVELFIDEGIDINAQIENGTAALFWAVLDENVEIVELLLNVGANVNIETARSIYSWPTGTTPIDVALSYENIIIIQLLLENSTLEGSSIILDNAFFKAADSGNFEIVEMCLNRGTDVNSQNDDEVTALMYAAYKGYIEITELLIDAGANVNIQDDKGWTAFMFAVDENHTEIIELLINKDVDVNMQNYKGWTALMKAADRGYTEIVKLLINVGADVNTQGSMGETALIAAANEGYLEITELLINAGKNINFQDYYGFTALMAAVWEGQTETVELLIEADANVNLQTNVTYSDEEVYLPSGSTALYIAYDEGYYNIAHILIEAGAIWFELEELLFESVKAGDIEETERLIGIWSVDVDAILQSPKIKAQLEAVPELEEMVIEMFSIMTIEFTAEEIIVEAMGESESMPYTVFSSTVDSVVIELEGKTDTINIISDTKIEMVIGGDIFTLIK